MLERTSYRGWENAYRISNDTIELVVLADVGPAHCIVCISSVAKISFTKCRNKRG
jgi:hypothetical protein